ncbi:MAG: bifunctional 5,10-methylenetetrahydrofolate dehydrogenase/5,10-methenyltetrahydrofolate cyclohydrolase [Brevinematia bacterium]
MGKKKMMLMKGNEVAEKIIASVREEIKSHNLKLKLTAILVGTDEASKIYVSSKKKDCERCGIESDVIELPSDIKEAELIDIIKGLNENESVTGILCQLPLPDSINEDRIIDIISPEKDADCFHPYNIGKLFAGKPVVEPCTPAGIIKLLDYYNIELEGKRAVVIGRSNIVGKPASIMLLQRNATVTICHSRTKNISEITKEADIVVVAVGKPGFLGGNMVKEGCVVVDVGIHRIEDKTIEKGYKIIGDVDFDSVSQKASAITPVPGGVGLMTRAVLMENILKLGLLKKGIN